MEYSWNHEYFGLLQSYGEARTLTLQEIQSIHDSMNLPKIEIDFLNVQLSYDIASGSEIGPCIKIDKPLVVYRFSGKLYDVHNNIAYIMTKS